MDVASVLATGAEARKRTWYHEAVVAWRTGVLPTLPDGDTKRLVGNALVGRRSYENARQAYFAALSGDPTNEGLLVGLGQVCFELGDQVAAIELFRTASRLHPDSYRARAVLASALALLGQKEDAVAEYERCLAVAAEEAQALRGLAHLLLFDDPVRAAQLFARVRANDGHAAPRPGSPAPKAAPANVLRQVETVLASAQQLVNQGRFSEAVCLIEGALALDPTSTSARAALGITLRAQHSYVPATRLYRKLAAELPVTN